MMKPLLLKNFTLWPSAGQDGNVIRNLEPARTLRGFARSPSPGQQRPSALHVEGQHVIRSSVHVYIEVVRARVSRQWRNQGASRQVVRTIHGRQSLFICSHVERVAQQYIVKRRCAGADARENGPERWCRIKIFFAAEDRCKQWRQTEPGRNSSLPGLVEIQ